MGVPLISPWTAQGDLRSATITALTGTVDALYPLTNLVDGSMPDACHFTTTSGMILFDLGSAKHIAWLAIHHHNFQAALAVKLRGYTSAPTNEATAAQIEISPKVAVQAAAGDNLRNDIWFDVDSVSAVASYRYWALVLPTNASTLWIGEVTAALTQTLAPRWFVLGDVERDHFATIRLKTYGGLYLRAAKETRVVYFDGQFVVNQASEVATIKDWFRSLQGDLYPLVVIPDIEAGDAYFCMLDMNDNDQQHADSVVKTFSWRITELSKGLAW
jgi:hypothetical protein